MSPWSFNLYAEYITQNAGLDYPQVGSKIARRNKLRYTDDATLMAESEEELKDLNEGEIGECKNWLTTTLMKEDHGFWSSYHFVANLHRKSGKCQISYFVLQNYCGQ